MDFLKNKRRAKRLADSTIARAARPASKAAKAAAAGKIQREATRLAVSQQPGKAKKLKSGLKVGIPRPEAVFA